MVKIHEWPDRAGFFKVVQIYKKMSTDPDPIPLIFFADFNPADPSSTPAHGSILEMGLSAAGVRPEYRVPWAPFPAPTGQDYTTPGMGFAVIDDFNDRVIIFNSRSLTYARGINREHLEKIHPLHPEWQIVVTK